jgi:hypothetical protein
LLNKYGHVPTQLEINKAAWENHIEDFKLDNEPDFGDAMSINWWLNLTLSIHELLPILEQFGALVEWTARTNGLREYGNNETNDISVCFDHHNKKVQTVSCRLDVRQLDKRFIEKALSLAKQFDCLFMDRHGNLYEPTVEKLADKIQFSNAYRFAENPKMFFDDFAKGIVKPE